MALIQVSGYYNLPRWVKHHQRIVAKAAEICGKELKRRRGPVPQSHGFFSNIWVPNQVETYFTYFLDGKYHVPSTISRFPFHQLWSLNSGGTNLGRTSDESKMAGDKFRASPGSHVVLSENEMPKNALAGYHPRYI